VDVDPRNIGEDDLDALLGHAFDRYVHTSGLFGSPARWVGPLRSSTQVFRLCLQDPFAPRALAAHRPKTLTDSPKVSGVALLPGEPHPDHQRWSLFPWSLSGVALLL
ncbi:hypothetical protein ACWDA9_15290, partial [Streptomyces sp. NPDC001193]